NSPPAPPVSPVVSSGVVSSPVSGGVVSSVVSPVVSPVVSAVVSAVPPPVQAAATIASTARRAKRRTKDALVLVALIGSSLLLGCTRDAGVLRHAGEHIPRGMGVATTRRSGRDPQEVSTPSPDRRSRPRPRR